MNKEKFARIKKVIGLGEKIYLGIDIGDDKIAQLLEETLLSYILSSLNRERRAEFYNLVITSKEPKEILDFLAANITDFERNLVERVKEELNPLIKQ